MAKANASEVVAKIEKAQEARRRRAVLRESHITMSHGSGGKATHNLIDAVFAQTLSNPYLDRMEDSAVMSWDASSKVALTTDTYVVSPVTFPGGDIGSLAVHGTINDLAMAGAMALGLSAGFILEEGFPIEDLRHIVTSMAEASARAHVPIVTGDTKVVPRGKGDGIYINTAGIGRLLPGTSLGYDKIRVGDKVIVSGDLGDHGIAVMLARESLDIDADVKSDSAPLHAMVYDLITQLGPAVHCLKDPTRGGVATTLNELTQSSRLAIGLKERAIPIKDVIKGTCELLGLDPLTIANEGKLIAIVDAQVADEALAIIRSHEQGYHAQIIGEVLPEPEGMVFMHTDIGGMRVLDMLVGDPLPRIC